LNSSNHSKDHCQLNNQVINQEIIYKAVISNILREAQRLLNLQLIKMLS